MQTQQTVNFIHWAMQIMSNVHSYALPLEPYILLSNITSSELKTLCKTFSILKTNPEVFSPSVNV